jgi:beta-glucosidase-like glycosyl hydrolase
MVGNGTLSIDFVQRAAVRVLTNRIMLGELIDSSAANPWRNLTLENELLMNKPLARRAAAESVVLLRNRDNTLPLSSAQLHSVAVVGPSADSYAAYLGDYAPQVGTSADKCRRCAVYTLYNSLLHGLTGIVLCGVVHVHLCTRSTATVLHDGILGCQKYVATGHLPQDSSWMP